MLGMIFNEVNPYIYKILQLLLRSSNCKRKINLFVEIFNFRFLMDLRVLGWPGYGQITIFGICLLACLCMSHKFRSRINVRISYSVRPCRKLFLIRFWCTSLNKPF